jgi:hypothetical protein
MEEGGVGSGPEDVAWLPSCLECPFACAARAAVMLERGLWAMAAIA